MKKWGFNVRVFLIAASGAFGGILPAAGCAGGCGACLGCAGLGGAMAVLAVLGAVKRKREGEKDHGVVEVVH